jgi:hypothetical protein
VPRSIGRCAAGDGAQGRPVRFAWSRTAGPIRRLPQVRSDAGASARLPSVGRSACEVGPGADARDALPRIGAISRKS